MRSWNFDRFRHARYWVAARLKQADRRIREVRFANPAAFWTALLGIVLFTIVIAIFISGTAAGIWATYHSNREILLLSGRL
jgi:hypothetical protein